MVIVNSLPLAVTDDLLVGRAGRSSSQLSGSVSPGTTCTLCRRKDWRQLEGDIWRLEKWLDHADRQLTQHLRNVRMIKSVKCVVVMTDLAREFLRVSSSWRRLYRTTGSSSWTSTATRAWP